METPKITGYRVVVLNGSCGTEAIDFDDAYARAHGIACDCGHKHKTAEAAEKCREKLLGYNKKTRTCSAQWYNSGVEPIYAGYEDVCLRISIKQ
jgi:hypothetical protein